MANNLSLDFYLIIKPRVLTRKYDIRDKDGNVLFEAKPNLLGTELSITDSTGAVIGETKHKIIAVAPTFMLYEGSAKGGKLIGSIKKPIMENMMSMTTKLDVQDQSGNVIAKASGSFFSMDATIGSYNITSDSGELIAQVGRQLEGGVMQKLGEMAKDAYSLEIKRQGVVSSLMLLEFLLCIELLRSESKPRNRGIGGIGLGGGGGVINF